MGRAGWLAAVIAMQGMAVFAQGPQPATERLFYPEALREDLETMRRAVHHLHPDPYHYADRALVDQRFDSVSATLTLPITSSQFLLALSPALRSVGDAHLRAELPQDQWDLLVHAVPLLPLKVRVLDGALYVEEELMGFRSIPSGSRVRRIDGIPSDRLLQELGALVQTDGHDQRYVQRVVERDFMFLLAIRYGARDHHTVDHVTPAGVERTNVLKSLTGEEMARSYHPSLAPLRPWRIEQYGDEHAAWLSLRTLDRDSLAAADLDPSRLIDLFLQDLRSNEVRTLVIDVRGAAGTDLGMAELVFSMIAREPYRVVKEITMRQPEGYAEGSVPMYASVGERSLPEGDRATTVPADDPRLAWTKPYEKAFTGKVYVVCDGLTRDAAAAFVMLAKRSGRARIVGEEVGSNSRSFCGGREVVITTPRSKLRLHVPSTRFVPEGQGDGPADHGELPHHAVEQQPWGLAKGRDTVRSALLEMIRELQ